MAEQSGACQVDVLVIVIEIQLALGYPGILALWIANPVDEIFVLSIFPTSVPSPLQDLDGVVIVTVIKLVVQDWCQLHLQPSLIEIVKWRHVGT